MQKDGWKVQRSPANLFTTYRNIFIDLEMSRGSNGNSELIMLVEVKCFPDESSTTRDLYTSIGQFLVYRAMLVELDTGNSLYLAVPEIIFETIFDAAVMRVIQESQINLVIIDLEKEGVAKWIKWPS